MRENYSYPIPQQERTLVVDVLRGFALAGVVLANLISFPAFTMPSKVIEEMSSTVGDKIYDFIFVILIDHKFITLFSLLFGYGFGVIMERVSNTGLNGNIFFARRMILLFVAGCIHLLMWWGEILHTYAAVGLLMLMFRRSSNKIVLVTACIMLVIPTAIIRYLQITVHPLQPPESEQVFTAYLRLALLPTWKAVAQANTLNHHYIYLECFYEAADFFEIFGKFLLGYLVLRKGYLKNVTVHLPIIRKFLWISIPIALLYITEMSVFNLMQIKLKVIGLRLLLFELNRFGVLMLSCSYAGLLVLIANRYPHAGIISALRYVGMMSLSNYLTHTLFYILLLHGVGFGLMGKTHLLTTFFIGSGIYVLQVFISKHWLVHFQYGPAEWIWRQLSYWKRFPIRKQVNS